MQDQFCYDQKGTNLLNRSHTQRCKMKILLAIDGSPCSKLAVDSVLNRPWPDNSEATLLTVLEPFHPELAGWHSNVVPLAIDAQKERESQARAMLEETRSTILERHNQIKVFIKVQEGMVKDTILAVAQEIGADMIILGSHGRKGITKLFLGSVSETVLAQAPCSVEIVKG
jgi:nucleotide-binding universal stress UspA family protein